MAQFGEGELSKGPNPDSQEKSSSFKNLCDGDGHRSYTLHEVFPHIHLYIYDKYVSFYFNKIFHY